MDKKSPYDLLASINSAIQKARQEKSLPSFQSQGLCFESGGQTFVMSLDAVSEILGPTTILELPRVKSWLKGAIQLRGQPILINDLGDYLLGIPTPFDHKNRIVVVEFNHEKVGFLLRKIECFVRYQPITSPRHSRMAVEHACMSDIQTDDKKEVTFVDVMHLCQEPHFLNTRRVDTDLRERDEFHT